MKPEEAACKVRDMITAGFFDDDDGDAVKALLDGYEAAVNDLNYACAEHLDMGDESICDICARKMPGKLCGVQCSMNSLGARNRWQWRGPETGATISKTESVVPASGPEPGGEVDA